MTNEVSLCMIVKDEEKSLPKCLESIKDLVDEIIIVDTGSKDKTIEIAKSYGAKVHYFKWCDDFSAARNESLKYATKNWILIMDADDEFYREDKEKFKKLIQDLQDNIIYYFETLSYIGDERNLNLNVNINPRLFKNKFGYYYEGAVHNQLLNSRQDIKGKSVDIRIYHYGYTNDNMINKNKRERNMNILKKLIEKEPENKFHYFNLGTEYGCLKQLDKALECYYKVYEKFDPNLAYSSRLIQKIVIINYELKKFEEALKFTEIGINYYPNFTDLYYIRGIIYQEENKPTLAMREFEKCIELGDPPSVLKCIYGVGTFRASDELARIYMDLKDYDMAYKYYLDTIKFKPDYLEPLYKIAHILKKKNTPIDQFKGQLEGFFSDFPREYFFVADLFYKEGYYETALDYIEKFETYEGSTDSIVFFKARCLVRMSKFSECVQLEEILGESDFYIEFSMCKVISLIILENYDLALKKINEVKSEGLSSEEINTLEVYKQLVNLFINDQCKVLSEDENEEVYTNTIFNILEILIINKEFDKFERTLNLLNLISDKSVLLKLGKLYYKYGYFNQAKNEIVRSIKIFHMINNDGVDILKEIIKM